MSKLKLSVKTWAAVSAALNALSDLEEPLGDAASDVQTYIEARSESWSASDKGASCSTWSGCLDAAVEAVTAAIEALQAVTEEPE